MTKFNKSLLTTAVVAALALPGLASAADLSYVAGKQITYAKDLIVNNGTTIYTPNGLRLAAESADATRISTVNTTAPNTRNVTVKVTLTDGAKFDTTADAQTLVAGFTVGTELGGTGAVIGLGGLVGTPYYSTSGQELNFTFTAPGDGVDSVAAGAYAIELNSMQVTNLMQGLRDSSKIGVEITAQNSVGQQILASKADLAYSQWGLTVTAVASPETTKKIDVGSTNADGSPDPKTWFAADGTVGGSGTNGAAAGSAYFNLGAVKVDITKAPTTGGGAPTYINNYSAVAVNPQYNVVGTADFKLALTAAGFGSYAGRVKFASDTACSVNVTGTSASAGNDTVNATLSANSPLLVNVTNPSPSASTLYVCAQANGVDELAKVDEVNASVGVDYKLVTQRVNPDPTTVKFGAIGFNGTELIFQNVNPAGNPTAQSFLRLTNNNNTTCAVEIDGKDDNGKYVAAPVKMVLPKHSSMQVNSDDLENGNAAKNITGGFTAPSKGKWYVRITAQCTNFKASALNRNAQTGTVTNLTPEKQTGIEWSVDKNNHL